MSNNNEIENDIKVEPEVEGVLAEDAPEPESVLAKSEAEILNTEIATLKEALLTAEKKAEENYELALRTKAESDNVKRRTESDVSNARKFGVEKFAQEMLPIIDSLELGLVASGDENASVEKFREGSEMTTKMFFTAVKKFGVEVVDPKGEKFNPEFHQAMSMSESTEVAPNTVLDVFQKGYTLQGRLLRPAMVIVSKAVEATPEKPSIDEKV